MPTVPSIRSRLLQVSPDMASAEEYLAQARQQSRALPRVFVASEVDRQAWSARQTEFVPHETRATHSVLDPRFRASADWQDQLATDFEAARARLAWLAELVELRLDDAGSDQLPAAAAKPGREVDPDLDVPGEIDFGPARGAENDFDRQMFQILRGTAAGRRRRVPRPELRVGEALPEDPAELPQALVAQITEARAKLAHVDHLDWVRLCMGCQSFSPVDVAAAVTSGPSAQAVWSEAELPKSARARAWECVRCQGCCDSVPSELEEARPPPPSEEPSLELLLAMDQVLTCKALTALLEQFLLPLVPELVSRGYVSRRQQQQQVAQKQASSGITDHFWLRCCPRHHAQHVPPPEAVELQQLLQAAPDDKHMQDDPQDEREAAAEAVESKPGMRVFLRRPLLGEALGSWLYSLLLRLDIPLYPEMAALLRDLFRVCAELRSLQEPVPGDAPVPLEVARSNLLMTVCERIFTQYA